MIERIDAVFRDGVFRPEAPVSIPDGQRVSLSVESKCAPAGELSDVEDLLDSEFMESCRPQGEAAPSLVDVRKTLSAFQGSLADRIAEERDER